MERKKLFMALMWKKITKGVAYDEPTSFINHVYLGCTLRQCEPTEGIVERNKEIFESRISAWATEKVPGWDTNQAKTRAWFYDMEGHAEKCVEEIANWQRKRQSSCSKLQVLAWMIITSRKRDLDSVGDLSKVRTQMYWTACTWHELVGEIFYGQWTNLQDQSQNGHKLVTEDGQDQSHAILIQKATLKIVTWRKQHNFVVWVHCKTQILLETLRARIWHRVVFCAYLEVAHLFQSFGGARSQISVSHSSQNRKVLYRMLVCE